MVSSHSHSGACSVHDIGMPSGCARQVRQSSVWCLLIPTVVHVVSMIGVPSGCARQVRQSSVWSLLIPTVVHVVSMIGVCLVSVPIVLGSFCALTIVLQSDCMICRATGMLFSVLPV